MLTRGQMALAVNQHGYDVVDEADDRISVKTVTSSGRASFNPRTIDVVDRIMVFQIVDSVEAGVSIRTLLDVRRADFPHHLRYLANGDIDFPIRPEREPKRRSDNQAVAAEAGHGEWLIRQYENATIKVWRDDKPVPAAMPELRTIAAQLGVDLRNGNGGARNTRQLGASVIDAIKGLQQ